MFSMVELLVGQTSVLTVQLTMTERAAREMMRVRVGRVLGGERVS